MAQTYYEILGVAQNASAEDIEAAFKKRAREVHPDTVAPGNAYLRQVAAEAFKDLSEAKAVLLNRTEREKYDAKLMYERGSRPAGSASSAPPPSRQAAPNPTAGASSRSQGARTPGPQSQNARAQASPRRSPARPPLRILLKPLGASLGSFAFVIVGVVSIFFVAWLMASGRTPPLWAAGFTLALGVASFRHGLKPPENLRMRGGIAPFLIGGFVVVIVFYSIWLPSTETVVTRSATEHSEPNSAAAHNGKSPGHVASPHPGANTTVVSVDDGASGQNPGLVTKVWKNVRDGKNYRTRTIGDVLFLEVIDSEGKRTAGIIHCDFRRTGPDWTGMCSERNSSADPSIRYSEATISTFSNTRLDGHTIDIPEFLMVPVDNAPTGASGSPDAAEPDLSTLSESEKQSIETSCASDKLLLGPNEYNHCLQKEIDALRSVPKPPDLSGLSSRDRDSMELVCSNSKLMEGPAAYHQCLVRQLDLMKKAAPANQR
jgi:curved DNA-binding protein CbpA